MRGFFLLISAIFMQQITVFDFNLNCDLTSWNIVDDVVMGGRSAGDFRLNKEGHGVFSGEVSLENNGGFSSLRYNFNTIQSANQSKFVIKLRGDGKAYQFRVKDKRYNRYSYISEFNTSGEWQTIEIPFSIMYPSFRGYQLDIPNFNGKQMQEIAFLIANKKAEQFKLIIDSITIE
ncbi:CIA30 family protein [Winogradskyella alexanderae]|uniref:CIA30 family protein n=1 Tax=Winogradskyella alexanderae TaxID=2877123 RepID=A0ABS7XTA9_9FLAO|nr:CIA30 family protein [Winogradskyella alexanderae]MCA0132246.1 CIA30 family protein [Winogradskyella alexanderae]